MSAGTPNPNWGDIELLDCVDQSLRNGTDMTKGNLAFEYLMDRFGYDRRKLPGYVKDVAENDAEDEKWAIFARRAEQLR